MSKVLVDRERLMRADADMGREGSASFTLDASDRLDRAWAELRDMLRNHNLMGFEIARHSKRLVEQLRSDLSAERARADVAVADANDAERALVAAPIAQTAPQQSGWISVEDRLPPIRQILSDSCVLEGKEIPTLYRSADVICWDGKRVGCQIVEWFHAKMPIGGVTHWMPLPAAPAQGGEG